ncbi:MarC family protein [Bizionia saleffrena]|nr:MarC family protein [Bizionia saleffrena]
MEVSLDAFQISGGVILFLFALTMIFEDGKLGAKNKY